MLSTGTSTDSSESSSCVELNCHHNFSKMISDIPSKDLPTYAHVKELNCEVEKMMCSVKDHEEDILEIISRSKNSCNILGKESQKFYSQCNAYPIVLKDMKEYLHNLFESQFRDYLKFPSIFGLPLKTDIYYEYFFGESPWDFTIICKNSNLLKEIQHTIAIKLTSLEKADPIIGETVLCKLKKLYFRGITIQSIDTDKTCKVYDIDRAMYCRLPEENVFALPECLEKFGPLTVRCTLGRETMSSGSWTPTLRNYFVNFLKRNKFKIKVFNRVLMENPPQYFIELIDVNGKPLEICKWFTELVLPAIKWTEHKIDLVQAELVDPEILENTLVEEEDICTKITYEVNEFIFMVLDKKKAIQEMIHRIQHFLQKRKVESSFLFRFRKYIYFFSSSVRITNEYIEKIYNSIFQQFINDVRVKLYGDIQPREDVVYQYKEGENPWDFVIRRIEPSFHLELTEYYASILDNGQREEIIGFPEFSKIYLCVKSPLIFRGLCFGLTTEMNIKMLNIDMGTFETVEMKNIFHLLPELQHTPPLAMRCSLMKNTFGKNKWTSKLEEKFKAVLIEKNLSIKIISQISSKIPFRYYVNLTIQNDVNTQCNYTDWFQNFIFPLLCIEGIDHLEDKDFDPFVNNTENNICVQDSTANNICVQDNTILFNGPLPTCEEIIDEFHDYDEVKICKFDKSGKQCWKNDCCREHIGNTGPGFVGSLYTYMDCEGILELPDIGDVIPIKPVHIVNALTFYAHLIVPEDTLKLNLSLLERRMNNFAEVQRYTLLETLPCIGELVMAPSYDGDSWHRARVIEVDDSKIQIFFIDYGNKKWIDYTELRKISFDFLYLPAQAVLCTLFSEPNPGIISNTNELNLNTVVYGIVLLNDSCNCELELVLYKQVTYCEN